ncbi:hypothetical protein OH77DRAFT_1524031 [Trametes cingulata]|nr:hypothetical protein OH77DRAFT_1524031 [Trametes cingulata]
MSCVSTPTATQFATFTTSSVSTSFSDSVSTLSPTVTTVTSHARGGGGTTTVQVPVAVTIPITSSSPTATLFSTSCSDNGSVTTPPPDTVNTSTTTVVETTSVLTAVTFQSSFTSNGIVVTTTGTSTTFVQVATTQTTVVSTGSAAPSSSGSSNTSAIVGGAVGGVVGAIVLTLALWFLLRRKRRYDFDDDLFLHNSLQDDHSKNVLRKNGEKGPVIDAEPRPYTYGALSSSAGPSSTAQTPSTENAPPLGYGKPYPPPRLPPLQIGPGNVLPPAPRPVPPPSNVSSASAYSSTHANTQPYPVPPPASASMSTLTTSGGVYDPRGPLHVVNDSAAMLPPPMVLSPPSEKSQIYLHPDRGLTTVHERSEGSGSTSHFPRGAGSDGVGSTPPPVPRPDPPRAPAVYQAQDAGRVSSPGVGPLNDAPPAYSE